MLNFGLLQTLVPESNQPKVIPIQQNQSRGGYEGLAKGLRALIGQPQGPQASAPGIQSPVASMVAPQTARSTSVLSPEAIRIPNQNMPASQYTPKNAHNELQRVLAGISYVESGGDYNSLSKASRNGDRAYGKYQVMGNNIPSWTKEALGYPMTPQQFLNNPEAQERTAAYRINNLLLKGTSPQDVASIWFSGRPQKAAGNAKDVYGTTVPAYIKKFNKAYLGSQALPTKVAQYQSTAPQVPPQGMAPPMYPNFDEMTRQLDQGRDDYAMNQALALPVGLQALLGQRRNPSIYG